MINYELAKELQDAGYPQPFDKTTYRKHGSRAYKFGIKGLKIIPSPTAKQYNQMMLVGLDVVYIPSLEELIKECGDCGFALIIGKKDWEAYSYYAEDDYQFKEVGSTPEEAVAKLWLALNNK